MSDDSSKFLSLLEVHIDDFRDIKQAHIKLDGITVVAGDNSSGKSTISKLLYYLFKISKHYDDIIQEKLKEQIGDLIRILRNLDEDEKFEDKYEFSELDEDNVENNKEKLLTVIQEMKEEIKINKKKVIRKLRIDMLIKRFIHDYVTSDTNPEGDVFDILKTFVEQVYSEYEKDIKDRNKNLFERKLRRIYSQKLENFTVKEYGKSIVSEENERLEKFEFISNAIYIDSPMAVEHPKYVGQWGYESIEIDDFSHWRELDSYLKQKDKRQIEKIIDTDIYDEIQAIFTSKEVLDGDVELDESSDSLIFHRNDGKSFKVKDCATGIKSLAILQTLYKHGWLTNTTLLVLDEPETHLHPQWIVEYARLIVFLHKKIGVTFFISSHSPNFVDAIQDIAYKEYTEKLGDVLRLYLAEIHDENYTYIFKDKGIDEEDIFASFNHSLNRIYKYGRDDE